MSIVVTGATGQLGRLTVESLLARGVPAEQIVAAGRNADRLAELAGNGKFRFYKLDLGDRGGMAAPRLLNAYAQWARGMGAALVQFGVTTGVHNDATQTLCERLGWRQVGNQLRAGSDLARWCG